MKSKLLLLLILITISNFCSGELHEFMYGDSLRTYIDYIPDLEPGPEGFPLVIGLHGANSRAISFIGNAALVNKADEEGFVFACPNALTHHHLRLFNVGGALEEFTDFTDDVGFISAVIDSMIARYSINIAKIYTMGHSNGAMMAYRLAAELSDRIAAIGTNSGQMIIENPDPEFPVPIIHMHGLSDSLIPYYGGGDSLLVIPPVDSVISIWKAINECEPEPDTIYTDLNHGIIGKRWNSHGKVPSGLSW